MLSRNLIILSLVICNVSLGQSFKALAPTEPIIAGESFRIQYIIEDAETISDFAVPPFKGFRIVSGPEVFGTSLKNTVYTLQALEKGKFFIPGARVMIDGIPNRCNDLLIEVWSREEAARNRKAVGIEYENSSFLRPGEDPYKKMNENLFLKVLIDKTSCYVGEPVVATFKLYSRLQSLSDIIKNPGFYGFTVQEMINLDDHMVSTEIVNGRMFDVHTVRKVQLYPLQAGKYTIDPMEVKSQVEFSKSVVTGTVEQKVIEGIFEDNTRPVSPGTERFETINSTPAVAISVNAIPEKNRPVDFSEAVGRFNITSKLEKNKLGKNEEGYLVIRVEGSGNFPQVMAPEIRWPEGIEGFEAHIEDALNSDVVPMQGVRTYRYQFTSALPGKYILPAINYNFFDPVNKKFKSLSTDSLDLYISDEEIIREKPVVNNPTALITDANRKASLIAGGLVVIAFLVVLVYWLRNGRKKKVEVNNPVEENPATTSVEERLRPASLLIPAADKDFYLALRLSIWNFLSEKFKIAGTDQSKYFLRQLLVERHNDPKDIDELMGYLDICDAGMYTEANLEMDRADLLAKVRLLLQRIKTDHSAYL